MGQPHRRTRRPNIPFPSYFNVNATQDVAISLTKVMGRHTIKTGLLQHPQLQGRAGDRRPTRSARSNFAQDTVGTNAVRHVVRVRQRGDRLVQLLPARPPTTSKATSSTTTARPTSRTTGSVNNRLTLDYGMRFVHAAPQYDKLGQGSNFLPDEVGAQSRRRVLYRPGCAVTVAPGTACPAASIQALQPAHRPAARPELVAGDRHARAGLGQPDQRPVPRRPGHRRHHLHLPGAGVRAALRHGLRPHRQAER